MSLNTESRECRLSMIIGLEGRGNRGSTYELENYPGAGPLGDQNIALLHCLCYDLEKMKEAHQSRMEQPAQVSNASARWNGRTGRV